MSRIIDTCCFCNELKILDLRLRELNKAVDYFVIAESCRTQSGLEKPYYFEQNKSRYCEFLHKIVYLKVPYAPNAQQHPWAHENFQRSCISAGLKHLNVGRDDVVLISDLDEVPKSEVVSTLKPNIPGSLVFGMSYNVYYLNLVMVGKEWRGTVAVNGDIATTFDPHRLIKTRDSASMNTVIPNAGWHFGYQGGRDAVFNKYFACIEPFNKNSIPNKPLFDKVFDEYVRDGGCFIHCDNLARKDLKLKKVGLETLPERVRRFPDEYFFDLLPEQFETHVNSVEKDGITIETFHY